MMPSLITLPSFSQPQRGASIIENTVTVMVFLLLLLAAFESTHWLLLRQALNGVLLDTARIAATQQAHPQIINDAFEHHLQLVPAFHFTKPWYIERLGITSAQTVQQSYQAQQYQAGNKHIFEDNTLHLRLHYLHQPLTPLVRAVVSDQLPIVTDVKVMMQSDQQPESTFSTTTTTIPPKPEWLAKPEPEHFQSITTNHDSSTATPPLAAWQPPTASHDTDQGAMICTNNSFSLSMP